MLLTTRGPDGTGSPERKVSLDRLRRAIRTQGLANHKTTAQRS